MIDVQNLTVRFRGTTALDDVSFRCRPGQVTGFLGPNGAGKSTAMRVVVGLTTPTSGRATVDGRRYRDLPNPGRHVGVLLDASAQHAGRTGRAALGVGARTIGVPASRVTEVLDLVGLDAREARRRVGHYSLGMRQRLGLAHALLGRPSVLVLDEPANGLDPAGTRWLRELLRDFADRGGTVLLSSHLLGEVEALADQLVVVGRGRVVAQGDTATLTRSGSQPVTVVHSTDDARLSAALARRGLAVVATPQGLSVQATADEVSRVAHEEQVQLSHLTEARTRLEDLFLALTADTQRDAVTEGASS